MPADAGGIADAGGEANGPGPRDAGASAMASWQAVSIESESRAKWERMGASTSQHRETISL
jgi:hypothetical protein